MMRSVEHFIESEIELAYLIKLIPSTECNPEVKMYYAHMHQVDPSVPYD